MDNIRGIVSLPIHDSFLKWANNLWIDLPGLNAPLATQESEWKEWAVTLLSTNRLGTAPDPTSFLNWRDWAQYFAASINRQRTV